MNPSRQIRRAASISATRTPAAGAAVSRAPRCSRAAPDVCVSVDPSVTAAVFVTAAASSVASAISRRQVAARAGLRNSSPGRGGSPPGRYTSADDVHSVAKSSRTVPTVSPTRSTGACPSSAYPTAYFRTSARDFVP
jgi:hypothetical protein